jgi:hypothetical protein
MTFSRQPDRQITDRQIAESQAYQLDQVDFERDRTVSQSQGFRRTNDRVIQQMQGARRQQERLIRERIVGGSQSYLIGDREPLTGLYQAIPTDGGAPVLGKKIFNAKASGQAVQVIDQGQGATPALNAANTKEPTEAELLAEIQQYTRFGNCKGYFLGQVYNCPEPVTGGKGLVFLDRGLLDRVVYSGSRRVDEDVYLASLGTRAPLPDEESIPLRDAALTAFYSQLFGFFFGGLVGTIYFLPTSYNDPWQSLGSSILPSAVKANLEVLGFAIVDDKPLDEIPPTSDTLLYLPPFKVLGLPEDNPPITQIPEDDLALIRGIAKTGGVLQFIDGGLVEDSLNGLPSIVIEINQFRLNTYQNLFYQDLDLDLSSLGYAWFPSGTTPWEESPPEEGGYPGYGLGYRWDERSGFNPITSLLPDGNKLIPAVETTQPAEDVGETGQEWVYDAQAQSIIFRSNSMDAYDILITSHPLNFYTEPTFRESGGGILDTAISGVRIPPELL